MVNQAAFQKVFRARFDEGRSNINASNYSINELKQQFLTDFGTSYTKVMKKSQNSFYNSPLYKKVNYPNVDLFSTLRRTLNFPLYDFPFLLSQTSDLIRYSWIDWAAQ